MAFQIVFDSAGAVVDILQGLTANPIFGFVKECCVISASSLGGAFPFF